MSSTLRKVLYVCHNHPVNRPGGSEIYARELYHAVGESGAFEPIFVARVGGPHSADVTHNGTRFALAGRDPNEYYIHTHAREFDTLLWTARRKRLYTDDWRGFLRALEPDVIHFQHSAWLGYDMIRETRAALPDAPIVYTLHEFVPICHQNGQMVRSKTNELCFAASPRRCHQCFPEISAQRFFLRERFIKSAFELVDLFITPSEHARATYIKWGLAPEKVRTENYGRQPVARLPDPPNAGRRNRIGFIGQMTPYKGVDLLLEAMKILHQDGTGTQLLLRGANLESQPAEFRDRVDRLLAETSDSVRFTGRYDQAELPSLLSAIDWVIVPSIWWETGPLVIHEALMHRRPVICSDIGSMVERISNGVNGLHFRVRDPYSLAATIRRAVTTPALWDQLRDQISDPHPMDVHMETILAIYEQLLAQGTKGANA
jgi:glycosyltransferase involved in cell wall biosynthesis